MFLSGQIPADPQTGALVTGSIHEQATRVIENLKLVLEAAGLLNPPARTTVEVARLPRDVGIEIEAIAIAK